MELASAGALPAKTDTGTESVSQRHSKREIKHKLKHRKHRFVKNAAPGAITTDNRMFNTKPAQNEIAACAAVGCRIPQKKRVRFGAASAPLQHRFGAASVQLAPDEGLF